MKKICMVIALVFCITAPVFSAESFTTTFRWSQANAADLSRIKEWVCEEVASGQTVTFPNVPGSTGPFVATSNFTLSGVPGTVVTHNYRIKAVELDGYETAWSNVMSKDYPLTAAARVGVPVLISVE